MSTEKTSKFSLEKARRAQTLIAKKVIIEDQLPKRIRRIAGADVAYVGDLAFAAAVVMDYESLEVLESQTTTTKATFPYVPTLLAFRELPAAATALRKLSPKPDVVLVDGHGKAHPYRCGLACHLGVVLNLPTIGVAKTRLVGEPKKVGENTLLLLESEVVGAAVTTKAETKPVYVSIGHKVSLNTVVAIVKHCSRQNRVPEPIRAAHHLASAERKAKIAQPT